MDRQRVVVTGLGTINPLTGSRRGFFDALLEGQDGIGELRRLDVAQYACKLGGEVKAAPAPVAARAGGRHLGWAGELLLAATRDACADAGLDPQGPLLEHAPFVTGTTLGGMPSGEKFYRQLTRDPRHARPGLVIEAGQHAPNDQVAALLGLRGPSVVFSTACSASAHAVGYAFEQVRCGRVPLALAGGFEALSELTFSGFSALHAMSADTIRPFDRGRSGLLLGEGAGMLVLEERAHAQRRGATVYAELVGYGASSDAHHMTAPPADGAGAAHAMSMALDDAGLRPEDVDYVAAHGTATRANDPAETQAIKSALGPHARRVAVSSIKSSLGHLLGAAGALSAIATVLAIHEGGVPPTIHFQEPDPECDLDYVPNVGRRQRVGAALCNAFGFGGNNCVLAFRSFND